MSTVDERRAGIVAIAEGELAALTARLQVVLDEATALRDAQAADRDPAQRGILAARALLATEQLLLAKSLFAGEVAEVMARRDFALLDLAADDPPTGS